MKMDTERLGSLKRSELKNLDEAVYKFTNKELDNKTVDEETREQLENLYR